MGTIVITGANRGIGLELAKGYQQRGENVIALCRNSSPELEGIGCRIETGVDVSSPHLDDLGHRVNEATIDVLINNAGIMRRNALEDLDLMTMREQYEVNSLAPLRVTAALMDRLSEGSKVAMVTSRMGSIADNDSGSHYGYRMSKAALNMGAKSLSLDLSPRGIAVCVLHPGWVRTDMTRGNGLIDADESAAGLMARIDGLTMENTGSFWHSNGDELPW
ncbi:MAG: SDR family oxidoreductase [Myxococcota bacterium]|jgi:NAD(P)-dependent dehydrogenase (short-subunit alcohol dehydrogenase family)|nr:short-chain dehydrogenase [Myxococcales bacterium]MEC7751097.1 SDR family oxidoreductase [Myxococcota bacterium]